MSRDDFKVSNGNKKVLELIPSMMQNRRMRKKLRALVLEFMLKKKVENE